jgi:hypothetical protein
MTGDTIAGTVFCSAVTVSSGYQTSVTTGITMAVRTGIIMRITYNVSGTGTVMTGRCTGRFTCYAGMVAYVMDFKVAVVVRRTIRAAVTACTVAR